MKHYEFVMTCRACPEQYDVYEKNKPIAYVRYRFGKLTVYPYLENEFYPEEFHEMGEPRNKIDFDTLIYEEKLGNSLDGVFDKEKRDDILNLIDNKIYEYYNN